MLDYGDYFSFASRLAGSSYCAHLLGFLTKKSSDLALVTATYQRLFSSAIPDPFRYVPARTKTRSRSKPLALCVVENTTLAESSTSLNNFSMDSLRSLMVKVPSHRFNRHSALSIATIVSFFSARSLLTSCSLQATTYLVNSVIVFALDFLMKYNRLAPISLP